MEKNAISVAIVDDENLVRTVLRQVVQILGLNLVGEATNGEEALTLYRKTQPDLLMMDVNMPVMNGDEALQKIRAEFPAARVVMLTSVADQSIVVRCLELGAMNYLLKNTSVEELTKRLKKTLDQIQARSPK